MEGSVLSADYFVVRHPEYTILSLFYYLLFAMLFRNLKDHLVYTFRYPKQVLFVHNAVSILINLYIFCGILYETTYTHRYALYGNSLDTTHTALTHYIWVFHMTKYYEFMDTMIMILRKSFRQITFLHVYHHATVVLYTWGVLYNHPGGDYYLGPLINAWVHAWMYVYYMLASFMNKPSRTKYLWWASYLTKAQILQFAINFSHSVYALLYSPYDTPLYRYGLYHQLSFIVLFGHFYFQKYKRNNCKLV